MAARRRNNSPPQQQNNNVVQRRERRETNLVTLPITNIIKAPRVFGEQTNGNTPIVLIPRGRNSLWRMTIPLGCYAIVAQRGANKGVYKPGFYVRSPWYKVTHLVTSHYIPYHFSVKSCPTKDNIKITLDVDFLLHVEDAENFVFNIGPENMEELLRSTQEESIRILARTVLIKDAYSLRGHEANDMLKKLNEKLNQYGIVVDQVTIANITLPKEYSDSLQTETIYGTLDLQQQKEQEYNIRIQETKKEKEKKQQRFDNELQKMEREYSKNLISVNKEYEEFSANANKELAELKTTKQAKINMIKANATGKQDAINADIDRIRDMNQMQLEMDFNKIIADSHKQESQIKAEAQIIIKNNEAKGLKELADAEAYVSNTYQSIRKHNIDMDKIDIIDSLANNENNLICGKYDDKMLQMVIARESAKIYRGIDPNSYK